MKRDIAMELLDAAKDGVPFPRKRIYAALESTGDKPRPTFTLEQIYARCEEVGECRIWKQSCTPSGYPRVNGGYAHLMAWGAVNGPVPAGMRVFRTCEETKCCEVGHMVLKTPGQVNRLAAQRGAWKGAGRIAKITKAARSRSSKCTAEIAQEIRNSNESGPEIEARLGISRGMASKIRTGKAWLPTCAGASIFSGGHS